MTGGMLASALRLAGLGTWVWDIPTDCLTWSEQTYRVVGMRADAFDGTLEGFFARVHEDDRAALREVVQRAFAGASPFSYRYRLRGDDGRERLIQGDGEVQFGGDGTPLRFIGTVVDITERERERQAIHDSEERFRSLVALSSDWYWQQDAELRFTQFSGGRRHQNVAARGSYIGKRRWEIPNCTPLDITWEEHQAMLAARLPFHDLELRLATATGERFVSISGEPFHDADGRFLGYRGTGADITERKASQERHRQSQEEMRQQLLRLNAELGERVRQRTAELEAANAELKALAHSLAHDLQSPVAAIEAFSELLEDVLPHPLPDRGAHYLGRIRAAARKTSEYAQGLLALARVSQAPLSVQEVDIGGIAADLLTQMAERDGDRQVQWQVQSGMVARGDATLLRIALDNLLGNAWKFTRDRTPARIEVACDTDAAGHRVYRVRDNGAGFDMAHAYKLFGNFQRLHTAQEFPGTGLGLANVLRIVGRHGGRVWAEAVEGEGACFYFTLSASPAEPSEK